MKLFLNDVTEELENLCENTNFEWGAGFYKKKISDEEGEFFCRFYQKLEHISTNPCSTYEIIVDSTKNKLEFLKQLDDYFYNEYHTFNLGERVDKTINYYNSNTIPVDKNVVIKDVCKAKNDLYYLERKIADRYCELSNENEENDVME